MPKQVIKSIVLVCLLAGNFSILEAGSAQPNAFNMLTRIMDGATMLPAKKGGKVLGMALTEIPKGSYWDVAGFANDDILQKVNNADWRTPKGTIDAFEQILTAKKLVYKVLRKGKTITILDKTPKSQRPIAQ